ncbi:MAG: hypothetical protein AB6733_10665 [Clostridiaceae bacterium]
MSDNERFSEKRVKELWGYLNEYGIYTEDQLDQFIKDNPLDIGIFTMPYKKEVTNGQTTD